MRSLWRGRLTGGIWFGVRGPQSSTMKAFGQPEARAGYRDRKVDRDARASECGTPDDRGDSAGPPALVG